MTPTPRHLGTIAALLAILPLARAHAVESLPARFGDGLCAIAETRCGAAPVLAVLSAFPAEVEPLIARMTVHETVLIGDRVLRVGTLGDVPVVVGLLGIGLVNAGATARLVLDHFDVDGLVVSGVAGSFHRIGDVAAPATWVEDNGRTHAADPDMLAIATAVAGTSFSFEHCTPYPLDPPGPDVCLAYEPALFVGGTGQSSDPFGGQAVRCDPKGGDVFGCDVGGGVSATIGGSPHGTTEEPAAVDMETAAVARETAARGVPFIAFRAVSDGPGDPLGLPGFPTQFFAYYRLAAANAATATTAFVERWGEGRPARAARSLRAADTRASCGWQRRATSACDADRTPPSALRAAVSRCCRLLDSQPDGAAAIARAWHRAARVASKATTRQRLGKTCAHELAASLRERENP